jgi:hypothetical protein
MISLVRAFTSKLLEPRLGFVEIQQHVQDQSNVLKFIHVELKDALTDNNPNIYQR